MILIVGQAVVLFSGFFLIVLSINSIHQYYKNPPVMLWHKRYLQSKIAFYLSVGIEIVVANSSLIVNLHQVLGSIYNILVAIFTMLAIISILLACITGIMYQRNTRGNEDNINKSLK